MIRWEIKSFRTSENRYGVQSIEEGWEPFAISSEVIHRQYPEGYRVWLRRRIEPEDEECQIIEMEDLFNLGSKVRQRLRIAA